MDKEYACAFIGAVRNEDSIYGLDARAQAIQERIHPTEPLVPRQLITVRHGAVGRKTLKIDPRKIPSRVIILPPRARLYGVPSPRVFALGFLLLAGITILT